MITVVSMPGCPWCDKVKDLLKAYHFTFDEQVLDEPASQASFARKWNIRTFPQVFVNDMQDRIGGYEDTRAWLARSPIISI